MSIGGTRAAQNVSKRLPQPNFPLCSTILAFYCQVDLLSMLSPNPTHLQTRTGPFTERDIEVWSKRRRHWSQCKASRRAILPPRDRVTPVCLLSQSQIARDRGKFRRRVGRRKCPTPV